MWWTENCCLCAAGAVWHGAMGETARGVQTLQETGRRKLWRSVGGSVGQGEQEGGHKDSKARYGGQRSSQQREFLLRWSTNSLWGRWKAKTFIIFVISGHFDSVLSNNSSCIYQIAYWRFIKTSFNLPGWMWCFGEEWVSINRYVERKHLVEPASIKGTSAGTGQQHKKQHRVNIFHYICKNTKTFISVWTYLWQMFHWWCTICIYQLTSFVL